MNFKDNPFNFYMLQFISTKGDSHLAYYGMHALLCVNVRRHKLCESVFNKGLSLLAHLADIKEQHD